LIKTIQTEKIGGNRTGNQRDSTTLVGITDHALGVKEEGFLSAARKNTLRN
jgi:hypothetical protein